MEDVTFEHAPELATTTTDGDVVMATDDNGGDSASSSSPEIWTIKVRSPKLPNGQVSVPTMPNSDLHSIVEFINEVLGQATMIESEFVKLFHKGKKLQLYSTVSKSLSDGDTVMLVFTPRNEIEAVRSAENVDHRIRSFEEEDALEQKRLLASSVSSQSFWGEEQDATYKFVKFEICPRFVHPHPYDAEKLLLKLATDPAIKKIMRKYQWTVGVLAEMDPKSDMISRRREAEDGACVLGYNENAGHKIYLRLRNDEETEFRGYDGLINTLLHELTHNVRGPHDEEFWKIFGQLKAEYLKFHETEYKQGSSKARRVINAEAKVSREIRNQSGNSALSQSERRAAATIVSAGNKSTQQPSTYIPMRLGAAGSSARRAERERLAKAAEARFSHSTSEENKCDCGQEHGPQDHHVHKTEESKKPVVEKQEPISKPTPIAPAVAMTIPSTNNKPDESMKNRQLSETAKSEATQRPPTKIYNEPSPIGLDEAFTSDREKRIRQAVIQLCRSRNENSATVVHTIVRNALTGDVKYKTIKVSSEKFKRHVDSAGVSLLENVGFERRDDSSTMVLARDDPGLLILARLLLEDANLVSASSESSSKS